MVVELARRRNPNLVKGLALRVPDSVHCWIDNLAILRICAIPLCSATTYFFSFARVFPYLLQAACPNQVRVRVRVNQPNLT